MNTTVEGVYQDGVIKLTEQPSVPQGSMALVTFLTAPSVDLRKSGINEFEAAELRSRLVTFAEDWDSPEMEPYDDYHAAKARL